MDHISFTADFVRGSWKAVLVSLIGLIIALSVISEDTMLLNSFRQDFFSEASFGWSERGHLIGDLRIQATRSSPPEISTWTNTTGLRDLTTHSLVDANYQRYLRQQYWHSTIDVFNLFYQNQTGEEIAYDLALEIPDQEFRSQVQSFLKGRWPQNYSEIVFVNYMGGDGFQWGPRWEKLYPSGVQIGQHFKISLSPSAGLPVSHNVTLTVVGVLEYQEIPWNNPTPPDLSTILIYNYFREERGDFEYSLNFLVTSPQLVTALVDHLNPTNGSLKIRGAAKGKLFLDYTQIDAFAIDEEIIRVQKFKLTLEESFGGSGFEISFLDRFRARLTQVRYAISMYGALFFVFTIPMLGVALYLVVYSYGLIRRQRQKQIGIIKTRGGTSWQVLMGLLGETLVGILFAMVGGLILGYLLTGITVRSVDLFNFIGEEREVRVSERSIQDLVFWGIILAVVSHFFTIIRLARMSIVGSEDPVEKRAPFWNRYYLDIWATALGLAGLFLIFTLFSLGPEQIPALLYEIAPFLIIPAPFFLLIGGIFLLSRVFPYLSMLLAGLLWKLSGGVPAFALKNVVRHKYPANRTVIVVTLVLTYTVFLGSFSYFYDSFNYQFAYSSIGADVRVSSDYTYLNNTLKTQISESNNIDSVSAFIRTFTSGKTSPSMTFLFVDPATFLSAAYFDEHNFGLSASLADLMQGIMDNNSIILYEGNSRMFPKYQIGRQFPLTWSDDNETETISLGIIGTFLYWPQLDADPEIAEESTYYWGVGSLGLFDVLNKTQFLEPEYWFSGYLMSLKPDADPAELITQIRLPTNWDIESPLLRYRTYLRSFLRRFLLSVLNSNLIVGISIAVISITMFAFFTLIERNQEIGVERALGMTRSQLALSFILEGGLVMVFGVVIGLITGLFYSTIVLRLFTVGFQNVPFVLDLPLEFLSTLILGVVGIASIGSLVPAYLASKRDISHILKAE
ncbi:MAG: FtsX-like permease family protein [Candidatus Thorarchaeota archaeon]